MDESELIQETVQRLQVLNKTVTPTHSGFAKSFDELIWHQDEPFVSSSIYAQWEVFRTAKAAGVTVMLDGQGSDEQLGGYHIFFGPLLCALLRKGRLLAFLKELLAIRRTHGYSTPLLLLKTLNYTLPESLRKIGRKLTGRTSSKSLWFIPDELGAQPFDPWRSETEKRILSVADLSRGLLKTLNLPMLLHYEDRNSMAHSIEARVPFLDYRLVEFTVGLKDDFKIRDGITKWILRKTFRGRISETILANHRKIGFETPETKWFENADLETKRDIEKLLGVASRYLTPHGRKQVSLYFRGRAPFSGLLFRVYCFEKWRQIFSVSI